ncbi:MAG: peptide chain release factor N(5)-glutamine methyltransferase [Urechidicola sp.]|nr:peptide chain release factor N(5)-glutamine methyltransferase [Urechidicola sp.]
MTLKELKQHFLSTLKSIYPKDEIDSFYFILIEHLLKLKRIDIALDPQKELTAMEERFLLYGLEKLQQEIPIQYVTGTTEFFGLPFNVDESVLIPRPETEELIDWILQSINNQQPATILDIGTGSGCIAISLTKNIPSAKVFGLDVSQEALNIAKQNAELNKVDVQFIKQDILTLSKKVIANPDNQREKQSVFNNEITSLQTHRKDELKFDIIVSNPPYVRVLEKQEIKKNVLDNEPHLALFVDDNNPLLFYDKIADFAKENLKQNGELFFEINQYLGKKTIALLKNKGFKNIELRKDIFENDRMIRAEL